MRAIVYTKYKSPNVLKLKEVEKPSPGDDEVLIKVHAAEVTAVDSSIKEDMLRRIGADHFFDYNKEYFTKSDQGYDVIFAGEKEEELLALKEMIEDDKIQAIVDKK